MTEAMPRRRPRQVRTEFAVRRRCRKNELNPIGGVSRRALHEIARVEETRNYLWSGAVRESLGMWRRHVGQLGHRLWDEDQAGCTEWLCCGDPHRARDLLEGALRALPKRAARELRAVVDELDERY
ncbi:hypothetical protein ACFU5O_03665 [Streptomyces sp. NPDC057445]|uniref:hypothetical protein n=1 Tax=Streptomyces sp. NPDC057445 TaxID=3346136 RepID=UPI0036A01D5B